MRYLSEKDLVEIGPDWEQLIRVVETAIKCLKANDYSQPIKPYLRYRDKRNRIIAMPAFVGGEVDSCGIKWVSSFPKNLDFNLPRAHSVLILNRSNTGEPKAIINTPLLSILRTVAISGYFIEKYIKSRKTHGLKIGIIGFGPIGQKHLSFLQDMYFDHIEQIFIYDIRDVLINAISTDKVELVNTWQEAYLQSDIVITCTVSEQPYINLPPMAGSMLLNVSLRDYCTNIFEDLRAGIVVDDWNEVCRENTDIERMHIEKNLQEHEVHTIVDVFKENGFDFISNNSPIMINPMGMSVFDISVGEYFYNKAENLCTGKVLE